MRKALSSTPLEAVAQGPQHEVPLADARVRHVGLLGRRASRAEEGRARALVVRAVSDFVRARGPSLSQVVRTCGRGAWWRQWSR